jgi:hypothetical protein
MTAFNFTKHTVSWDFEVHISIETCPEVEHVSMQMVPSGFQLTVDRDKSATILQKFI